MIRATKNGVSGIFSDNDWKSGQPQRYGWQEEGHEKKTLPKEIVQFIERRKEPVKVEPSKVEKVKEIKKDEPIVQIVKKTKTKKNDNPKQKGRTPGKRKP